MDITIQPRPLRGQVQIPPSKSIAHRMLICAALADNPTQLVCPESSRDIAATIACLQALGASILPTDQGYTIFPMENPREFADLFCGESGSTLRFLLPLVGALGVDATFHMEGRLPCRPLSPLWEEMECMGCVLSRPSETTLRCQGKLKPGHYTMDGSVSSQFITGLLFALSLLPDSRLDITGEVQSAPYIAMTKQVMEQFHAPNYHSPGYMSVEGDWSNAAFWLAAQSLGSDGISVLGLDPDSPQGDRAVLAHLSQLSQSCPTISAAHIPDLIPILSVVAAAHKGAVFTDIQRLRLKESDRVSSTVAMIQHLGGRAVVSESTLTIYPTGLRGGIVDSFGDHRIAMSAAIAATVCRQPVTILGAQCVDKSYPAFWQHYTLLGGKYDQFLR